MALALVFFLLFGAFILIPGGSIITPGGVHAHGVRVLCLGPVCHSRLYKIKELLPAPCLLQVLLENWSLTCSSQVSLQF